MDQKIALRQDMALSRQTMPVRRFASSTRFTSAVRNPAKSCAAATATHASITNSVFHRLHSSYNPSIFARSARSHGTPHRERSFNHAIQMKTFLMGAFGLQDQKHEEDSAMNEVTEAVDKVMSFGKPVELSPQSGTSAWR